MANDATAVGDIMRELGYEVIRAHNVDRVDFLRLWNRFLNALEPRGTGMFFFAGHGSMASNFLPRYGNNSVVPGYVTASALNRRCGS